MDNTQTNSVNPSPDLNIPPINPVGENVQHYNRHKNANVKKILRLYFEENRPQIEIAQIMGLSDSTIDYHLKPFKNILLPKQQLQDLDDRRSDLLKSGVYQLLSDTLDPDKREKASLNNAAFALGKVHEIYRLETNQSTQNTSSIIQVTPGSRQAMAGQMSKVRAIRGSFEGISQTIKTQDGDTVD
jgi:hypothetical protein